MDRSGYRFALGLTLGLGFGRNDDDAVRTVGVITSFLGIAGLLIGAAAGTSDRDEEVYRLAGAPLVEKGRLLQDLIGSPPAFPQP